MNPLGAFHVLLLASFGAIPWRRYRLLLDKVNICLRRNLKRELRLAIHVSDGEVTTVDDIHADQHISTIEAAPTHLNVLHSDIIRQLDVDQIDFCFIRLVVDSRVVKLRLADGLKTALVDYALGDQAPGRASIPYGLKLMEVFGPGYCWCNLAWAYQDIGTALGRYSKGIGLRQSEPHDPRMTSCICVGTWTHGLNEKRSQRMGFLCLGHSFDEAVIHTHDSAILDHDNLAIVLGH